MTVNSIGYLMNAIRLRQDLSPCVRYNLNIQYDTYKHQTQVFYFIVYYYISIIYSLLILPVGFSELI
jgi:hypothetical protein